MGIKLDSTRILDSQNREILLRGINLGGDCKFPFPKGATFYPTDFSENKDVSFVGRPFPLEEAEEHFHRLKVWGFNCIRMLTTWEAIEHQGPGIYDEEYLSYFTEIIRLAGEFGFYVFVDFHQDVWSRMTGGDGAPGWTMDLVGMDISKISASESAKVMQSSYDFSKPGIRQEENYPTMCWSQNYNYPANGIMWTLFFGGRDFAPNFKVYGKNIQDFLEESYFGCVKEIAKRIFHMDHVLGFDSLNEPGKGFIGKAMNDRGIQSSIDHQAKPGLAWSPIDALFASQGFSVEIPYLEFSIWRGKVVPKGMKVVNPSQVSLWKEGNPGDPFQLEGAWSLSKDGIPYIENNSFFQVVKGKRIDFDRDHLMPFLRKMADLIQGIRKDWVLFAEKEAGDVMFKPIFPGILPKQVINSSHWYDLPTLFFKRFLFPIAVDPIQRKVVFGKKGIRKMYVNQLNKIKEASIKMNCPTLIGEFGIPFDLRKGKAYQHWKNGKHSESAWKEHNLALSLMYDALDELQLSATLWNYTASNQNDLMKGDGWNQEDLSIFSRDQILPNATRGGVGSGGRAISGFSRPYPRAIHGKLLHFYFDFKRKVFECQWKTDSDFKGVSEFFVPRIHFPKNPIVKGEGIEGWQWEEDILKITSNKEELHKLILANDNES